MKRVLVLMAVCLLSSTSASAECVLGNSLGTREFSVPRNGVCVIRRYGIMGMKLVSIRTSVRPKLGKFGTANIEELAYRAGNTAGDDYFEYVSVQSFNGGPPRDYITKNFVHITP